MKNLLKFVKDESGATAIEYGLIAAGISVAIITVVAARGRHASYRIVGRSRQRAIRAWAIGPSAFTAS